MNAVKGLMNGSRSRWTFGPCCATTLLPKPNPVSQERKHEMA